MASSKLVSHTMQTDDFELTNINQQYTRAKFYRQGNIVVCDFHILSVKFINTLDHTLLKEERIPIQFRPASDIYFNVISYEGNVRQGLIKITTTGAMYIRMGQNNTNMNVYGSLTYIVEE